MCSLCERYYSNGGIDEARPISQVRNRILDEGGRAIRDLLLFNTKIQSLNLQVRENMNTALRTASSVKSFISLSFSSML